MPTGPSGVVAVTTVTPVAKRPMTERKWSGPTSFIARRACRVIPSSAWLATVHTHPVVPARERRPTAVPESPGSRVVTCTGSLRRARAGGSCGRARPRLVTANVMRPASARHVLRADEVVVERDRDPAVAHARRGLGAAAAAENGGREHGRGERGRGASGAGLFRMLCHLHGAALAPTAGRRLRWRPPRSRSAPAGSRGSRSPRTTRTTRARVLFDENCAELSHARRRRAPTGSATNVGSRERKDGPNFNERKEDRRRRPVRDPQRRLLVRRRCRRTS